MNKVYLILCARAYHKVTKNSTWISYYIHGFMWDLITRPNFEGLLKSTAVDFGVWMGN